MGLELLSMGVILKHNSMGAGLELEATGIFLEPDFAGNLVHRRNWCGLGAWIYEACFEGSVCTNPMLGATGAGLMLA